MSHDHHADQPPHGTPGDETPQAEPPPTSQPAHPSTEARDSEPTSSPPQDQSTPRGADHSAEQDFEAALHEIVSNLDVRRLMIVIANVLVPASTVATANALSSTDLPNQVAWLPRNILWIVGGMLAISGLWTSAILARCHFGLVVNGTKMAKVRTGAMEIRGLNWLGVTTNFLTLTALSAGGGVALVGISMGQPWIGMGAGCGVVLALLLMLRIQHGRAYSLCRRLEPSWQHGEVSAKALELHARKSLDSTSADVAVIVTMGAALFAGTFDATCTLGSVSENAIPIWPTSDVKFYGVVFLMGFTWISLLLTGRIVVRLRIALAGHAATLAALRDEHDQPWRFSLWERSFLLFLLVAVLTCTAALVTVWTLAGPIAGGATAGAVFCAHLLWYPMRLGAARRAAS